MKQVFSNNSQVCHVWAQQNQPRGRSENIFFEGDTIFSYGYHYPMAKIHTYKGRKFALINSKGYSHTTSQHTSNVRSALNGLMPYYNSPDINSCSEAVKHLDQLAKEKVTSTLKVSKVTDTQDINWNVSRIKEVYEDANSLRKLLGKAEIKVSTKDLNKVKEHLLNRLRRYKELNTPEMIEKKRVTAEKRLIRKEAKEKLELDNDINNFRKGLSCTVRLHNLSFELLRIKDNEVETSRGAQVPLNEAFMLHKALKSGKTIIEKTIGHFTVESITDLNNDKIIKIGCHKILLSEADRVLKEAALTQCEDSQIDEIQSL